MYNVCMLCNNLENITIKLQKNCLSSFIVSVKVKSEDNGISLIISSITPRFHDDEKAIAEKKTHRTPQDLTKTKP